MYIIDDEKRIVDAGITKEQFDRVMSYVLGKIEDDDDAEKDAAVCIVDITNDAEEVCTVSYRNEANELTTDILDGIGTLRINVAAGTDFSILSRGLNEMSLSNYDGGIECVAEAWLDTKQVFRFTANGDGTIYFER